MTDLFATAVLEDRARVRAQELAAALQSAFESRIVVEQAKGVMAQRLGVSPDAAFHELRREARSARRPLRDVAREVVDSTLPR